MSRLLDRDPELAALGDQLASVRAGNGRLVVVEGPAGIGKSSLAAALATRALDPGAPEPAMAGDAVHAAVHGLVWLASNLAEFRPTLLVVDDVHWADGASLRWLAALVRRLDELRLGVLCTVRTGEPASEPDLLAELLAAAPDPSVRPRSLSLGAAEAIVAGRLPGAEPGFARACHAVTAGNPFLLGALLGHLLAEGIAPDGATAARLETFGPDQVVRAVDRQLARLPAGAGDFARALAVLGQGARLDQAARLCGCSLDEAGDLADALRGVGLVAGGSGLGLAHPLIASALYRNLPLAARGRLHAAAGRALVGADADPERRAQHLLHTSPAGDAEVVAALHTAAQGAMARGAPESAERLLRRALAEPPPDRSTSADVRLGLGLARAARWQPDAPVLLSDAIGWAGTPAQRALIALAGARALGLHGYFREALELCRCGLGDGSDVPAHDRARLEAELRVTAQAAGCPSGLPDPSEESVRRAAASPGARFAVVDLAIRAAFTGQPTETFRALAAPLVAGGLLQDEADSVIPTAVTFAMIANDDLDGVLAWCSGLLDLARPRGWVVALTHASWLRSMALVRAGRIRAAEPDAQLAMELTPDHTTPEALMWSLHTLVDVLVEGDRLDEAEAMLVRTGLLDAPPPLHALASPLLLQARARLRLAQHRPEDARADAYAAGRRWVELEICHPAMASWRVEAVEALVELGERTEALALAREHLRLADRLGSSGPRAAGLRALARAGDVAERLPRLQQAAALGATSQARIEQVRVLVELGAALRRANRRADARVPLQQALTLADQEGMALLARRTRTELCAAGGRPRRPASTGPQSLTAAERRVVDLAVEGFGNPEIAGQLYVTRRTVETHLTHAFQKLAVSSRADLAGALVPGGAR